jgi:hypothetical protein
MNIRDYPSLDSDKRLSNIRFRQEQ